MKAISLFTGGGGFDCGLERAGIETVLQCDLFDASHLTDAEVGEPCNKPNAHRKQTHEQAAEAERRKLTRYGRDLQGVLERHWPGVERVNDVRNLRAAGVGDGAGDERSEPPEPGAGVSPDGRADGQHPDHAIGLIHFGSPCQDLSIAGKRAGFVEGGRSHLFFEAVRVIREVRPEFALWENVPDALNSNGGRDFAAVLAALADAGAVDIAWRVLDARWFGVAQRRRRVFVVADFRGERAAEILFEPGGGEGTAQARGAAREDVAFTLAASVRGTGDGHGNIWNSNYVAAPVVGHHGHSSPRGDGTDNLIPIDLRQSSRGDTVTNNRKLGTSGGPPGVGVGKAGDRAFTVSRRGQAVFIPDLAYAVRARDGKGIGFNDGDATLLGQASTVRRLTPRECERLQGWPDDWTRWTADGREVSDSHRYMMIGNGVASPVAEWLGRRLMAVMPL